MSDLNSGYKKWHKPVKNIYNEDGNLKRGQTHQGYYQLKNRSKYIGDPRLIIYRSSWEFSFCKWCDHSPSILKWSSEPTKVPYYDKITKLEECKKYGLNPNNPQNWLRKNYNLDFWVTIKKPDETIEKWFIEVKPKSKLLRPSPPSKNAPLREQKRFNRMAKEFLINEEKFKAAKEFAERNGAKFYIFTEDQLTKFGIIGGRFDMKIIEKPRKGIDK
jgi:hypothetical protein